MLTFKGTRTYYNFSNAAFKSSKIGEGTYNKPSMRVPPVDAAAVFSRTSDPSLASLTTPPTLFELSVSVSLWCVFLYFNCNCFGVLASSSFGLHENVTCKAMREKAWYQRKIQRRSTIYTSPHGLIYL